MRSAVAPILLGSILALGSLGCQDKEEMKYKPVPASTAPKPQLPEVPSVPTNFKQGEAFTVFGAIHHLHSRIHNKDVSGKEITVVGTIVAENISSADACAWHKTGKKDPDDCKTEVPTFAIADDAADATKPRLRVMGWASNFANVYEAYTAYHGKKDAPKELYQDAQGGKPIPFPLPAIGARVKVTGTYDYAFRNSTGVESDPANGILTYSKLEVLEPAAAEVEAPKPAKPAKPAKPEPKKK